MVRLQCRVRPPLVTQQTNLQVRLPLVTQQTNLQVQLEEISLVVRPGQMDQQQDLQQPMALVDLIGLQPTPPQFKRCWTRTRA